MNKNNNDLKQRIQDYLNNIDKEKLGDNRGHMLSTIAKDLGVPQVMVEQAIADWESGHGKAQVE